MLDINFSQFPELETQRLKLRKIDLKDINEIFAMRSKPEVMQYIPKPLAITLEDASTYIKMIEERIKCNEGISWAITLLNDPKMIGTIGLFNIKPAHFRAEIGYMLHPDFHGKGYIPEAVAGVVGYGFDKMKLHSIEAIVAPGNSGSARVLEKCGFIKEAHFIENEFYNGKFIDTIIYSKLQP